MRRWITNNKVALLHSIVALLTLSGAVWLLFFIIDIATYDTASMLFSLALFCCLLLAIIVFNNTQATQELERITESFKNNDSLTSKALYVELYKNSPVPYLIIDHTGCIHSANLAACRMFGVSQAQVTKIKMFEAISGTSDDHVQLLKERFRNGISFSDEKMQVKRNDHNECWALMSLYPISHVPGNHIGLVTLVDITKQKKIEEAKTQFVALASHQLRTPIAGIRWSTELLQMDNPKNFSDRQRKYIDRLLLSVKRMSVLVDDFLRVSRFELGTFVPELNRFDVREVFEDVQLELGSRVSQKRVTVKSFYDDSVSVILSDRNLVRMIITNLFSNAIKYTKTGGTIHVGYKKKDDAIVISVVDNGMGIPEEDQSKIFSKLFRAKNAVRDVPDGTGLGLYIVKEAVAVLKGHISFTSVERQGTTFEVALPTD